MIRNFVLVAALPVLLLVPRIAHAGIESCGNIDVKANAQCKIEVEGGCTAQCEPVRFEAQCAAKLSAQCNGECTGSIEASCTASCEGSCVAECEVNPPSFDCTASCQGSCDADCDAQCSGSASGNTASGSCKAKCSANCSGKCSAQCSGTAGSATCQGKCQASCRGSCQAKASARCQIDCQGRLDASCRAELEGGCKAKCQKPEGALFCDGQYVDTGNNLQECVDALRAALNIQVEGSASAQCAGNQCSGEAEGSVSCATSPASAPVLPGLAMLAMVGATIARKTRRGRR